MTYQHEGIGHRIDDVWIVLAGPRDDEGVVAAQVRGTMWPLVAADAERLDRVILPMARRLRAMTDTPMRLVRFTARQVVIADIEPEAAEPPDSESN